MRAGFPVVMFVVAACGSKDPAGESGSASPAFAGPLPVTFGDCAGPTVAFVSGPKPLPFTLEEAAGVWVAAAPAKRPAPLAPALEKTDEDADESGGMGTAMALEEGKMGRRDASEPPGEPVPLGDDGAAEGSIRRPKPVDPKLAREQTIEAARAAGLLGSTNAGAGGAFATLTGTGDLSSGFDDANIYGGLLGSEIGELNGGFGFGRTGFGPGGGSTGWGTIGTGRYGSIGHGSGTTGYGIGGGGSRGGMRGRAASVPTVSVGSPNAQGDLDKAIIRRYIKRNIQKIQYCYEKALLVKPTLAGTISTQFFITPKGDVASASASGVDPEVSSCVAGVIKAIEFPKPKGGGGVQVNYPFTFRPADTAVATGSGSAGSGSATGRAALPDPGPPRELFRSRDHQHADAAPYTPGSSNPLRTEEAALTACFRKNAKPYGVAVVALAYDASGAVETATVHGLDDANTSACVTAAARKIKRAAADRAAQRCPVAFGELPIAEVPAIDITADAIRFGGKDLATLTAVRTSDVAKIVELDTAVEARHTAVVAASGPVVAIHAPVVIRPLDATPMKVVVRVLATVLGVGEDFQLAARRGTEWKLLVPMTFPTVPVPFGTGGMWNHVKGKARSAARDEERPSIIVLVTPKSIWVGLSQGGEFEELARDATQRDTLLAALAKRKAAAKGGLEIAGDDDATYGDVVSAIETIEKAGFVDWRITDPGGLAARPPR